MTIRSGLNSPTFKVFGIGVLALLMLIPLASVQSLIGERQTLAASAREHIAERWGASQTIGGPVFVVPVRTRVQQDRGWTTVDIEQVVLPDRLAVRATLVPDVRRYGIYETPVYVASVRVEGSFRPEDFAEIAHADREPQWERAELRVPIADVRGIRRVSTLKLGGRDLTLGPASKGVGASNGMPGLSAVAAAAPFDTAPPVAPLSFAFELTLAGSERLAVLPLARQTEATIASPWRDPGFDGAFLPAERRVDDSGFEAQWQVLDLNRRYGQTWRENEVGASELESAAFGVSLTQPAGTYQQNVRAGKYGVLFVALTFIAFFLFEVLQRLRVHPVQYLLIGLALCTFYVVLLALSEQVGFALAYAIAAAAVASMIGGYAAAVLATRRAGAMLGALVALVYALLYGLVVSEDYALLMGALALLGAVAALMYLTRRVDWYALGAAPAVPRGTPPSLDL